jgi:type IV secretory pathway VirB4 component
MTETKKTTSGQSTKDFVQIADIRDTVVILKDGSLRSIVETGSMNFELKSADEQIAIIQRFQNLLNSIDFSIQILVSSRKLDINPYLKSLEELTANLKNELLKIQAAEYTRFIKGLAELANIMAKKFYIVVSFYPMEVITPTKKGFLGAFKSVVSPSKFIKTLSDEELENYKIQLNQRIEVIIEGLSGLGIETRILAGDELKNLFYSYYNPK